MRIRAPRPNTIKKCLVKRHVEPGREPFLLGTSVTFYRLDDTAIDGGFFFFYLQSPLWQGQLGAVMQQTTRNQVSIQKQAYFRVPLPSLNEQRGSRGEPRDCRRARVARLPLSELAVRVGQPPTGRGNPSTCPACCGGVSTEQ